MTTDSPERIWLEDPAAEERVWCDHNAWADEPDCQPVEYVRKDVRDADAAAKDKRIAHLEMCVEEWRAALEAARRPDRSPAGEVRVKPLEWEWSEYRHAWVSQGPLHAMEVFLAMNENWTLGDGQGFSTHPSEAAAKEAGRVELQKRILAALSPAPAPEPMHEDAPRAVIGEIGNQVHNLSCSIHGDEVLQAQLGQIASDLWEAAKAFSPEPAPAPELHHYSGCAVHNAPAYEPGPCDCGGYIPAPEREGHESIIDRMAEAIYRADDHPPGPPLPPLFLKTKTGPLHERQREKYRAMARAALSAAPAPERKDADQRIAEARDDIRPAASPNAALLAAGQAIAELRNQHSPGPIFAALNEAMGVVEDMRFRLARADTRPAHVKPGAANDALDDYLGDVTRHTVTVNRGWADVEPDIDGEWCRYEDVKANVLRALSTQPAPAEVQHYSSCAVHNGPAYEPGPCDCEGYVAQTDPAVNGLVEAVRGLDMATSEVIRISGTINTQWMKLDIALIRLRAAFAAYEEKRDG